MHFANSIVRSQLISTLDTGHNRAMIRGHERIKSRRLGISPFHITNTLKVKDPNLRFLVSVCIRILV
jgi:hypothetical protein